MSDVLSPDDARAARAEAQGALAQPLPPMSDGEVAALWRQAKALAESGLFKDAQQAGQAFAKILAGRDLGLTPFESMGQLHVIEGKVEASSDLHATRVRSRDGYDYEVWWIKADAQGNREAVRAGDEDPTDLRDVVGCAIAFTVDGEPRGVSRWTIEDSELAGLNRPTRSGAKSNHTKFPRSMFFARAMTNGVAWYVPEVMGGMRVYGSGELPRDTGEDLTRGEGRPIGDDPTDQLPTEVEAVIARARQLGHAGLSDRATALMAVQGGPEVLARWLKGATAMLNRMAREQGEPIDATAVEEPSEADTGPSASESAQEPVPTPESTDAPQAPDAAGEAGESRPEPDADAVGMERERLTAALIDAEQAAEDAHARGDAASAEFLKGEAAACREQLAGLDSAQGSLGL